jgi:hypothetical protein
MNFVEPIALNRKSAGVEGPAVPLSRTKDAKDSPGPNLIIDFHWPTSALS